MKKIFMGVLIVILFAVYFLAMKYKWDTTDNVIAIVISFVLFLLVYKGCVLKEEDKLIKMGEFFLSLGLFTWFLSETIWAVADLFFSINPVQITWLTNVYSFTNLFILFFFIVSSYMDLKKWNWIQVLIDTFAITVCVMILVWVIFFDRDMRNAILTSADWISQLSIIIDFLTFIWIAVWFFSVQKHKIKLYIRFIASGCVMFLINDLIFFHQYLYTGYKPNSLLDANYLICFAVIAIGASLKTYKETDHKDLEEGIHGIMAGYNGFFLILAPIILILWKGFLVEYLLALVSVIMIYFLISYIAQKSIYRDRLLVNEMRLNKELEQKVEERTKELNRLIDQDAITGLFSRRYFLKKIKEYFTQLKENETIVLFYIDLNKYKMMKTVFGNYIGEKTLIMLGKKLEQFCDGENSILASYGEDVMVLIIRGGYTYKKALELGNRMIQECSTIYQIEKNHIQVSINIGISIYPLDAQNEGELIKHGDIAMFQSRNMGYNKVLAYEEHMSKRFFRKSKIELMLKKADYEKEFYLCYQPQVICDSGELYGFEANLRWITPEGEKIGPDEFIPIAEETGCIVELGYWAMKKAVEQLANWDTICERSPQIAINVSAKQVNENQFTKRLKEILDLYHMEPGRIEIEITESIQLEENREMRAKIIGAKKLGLSISIDDFGTGYSSLYYLKYIAANRIKLAKELIDHIVTDQYSYSIVKAIVEIADTRGIRVLAEGVETKEQLDCLKQIGCHEIQGFYFGKPLSSDEAIQMWIKNYKKAE